MADRTRGRQRPIQAEFQQQLAAVAEQHVRVTPATTVAHGRRWSAASADRRRRICRTPYPTTIPPALLGQVQQQAAMLAAYHTYDTGCAFKISLRYPVLLLL